MVFVRNPEHAVFHRAVFHARGRTGTAGTALCDHGQFFGFFLAGSKKALGPGFVFELVGYHPDESP
jgi:hypothetical protein